MVAIRIGALAGLSAYTFDYGEGLSYFSTDPRACKNCHVMNEQYASWSHGPHHAVAKCIDCHLPHAFAIDYRDRRGHAHMLQDQEQTKRVTDRPQPGALSPMSRVGDPDLPAAGWG